MAGDRRFDRPVADWLDAMGRVEYDTVHFRELLAGLSRFPRVRVNIATNGHWDPEYFAEIDKSRIHLVIAWHPGQVTLDEFHSNLRRIREAGFNIWMVNFVLAPDNIDRFDEVFQRLEDDSFFVNVSAMLSAGSTCRARSEAAERAFPLVSIVILTHNSQEFIGLCCEYIRSKTRRGSATK
jgi:hypothetical protein